MKKITTCFLVMVIAVGCAQAPVEADKPEEPPVVEQPQKPVEQEKPKEETKVKKIDESKEYIYIKETRDEANDEIFKDLAIDYIFEGFDKNDFLQWMAISYMPDPITELLVLNIDSADAKSLNDYFMDLYENQASLFCEWKWDFEDNLLSIFKKAGSFIPFSTGSAFYEVIHINMENGEIVTNQELLEQYNVDENSVQMAIDAYCENHEFYKHPGYRIETPEGIKGSMIFDKKGKNKSTVGHEYSDESFLIVEDSELYYIVGITTYNFYGRILFHKIKIS